MLRWSLWVPKYAGFHKMTGEHNVPLNATGFVLSHLHYPLRVMTKVVSSSGILQVEILKSFRLRSQFYPILVWRPWVKLLTTLNYSFTFFMSLCHGYFCPAYVTLHDWVPAWFPGLSCTVVLRVVWASARLSSSPSHVPTSMLLCLLFSSFLPLECSFFHICLKTSCF